MRDGDKSVEGVDRIRMRRTLTDYSMRLGFVGMLQGDPRQHREETFEQIRSLGVPGVGFHLSGDLLPHLSAGDIAACRQRFSTFGLELAQTAITYRDCLFDPSPEARKVAVDKILTGAELSETLGAQAYLIRPGSLNPAGSWTPHPDNHQPESIARLEETLRSIANGLDGTSTLCVLETHVVSIVRSPEVARDLIQSIDSPHLKLVADPVNHFESLPQVFDSTTRLKHIFDLVGADSPVLHIKDIKPGNGLVVHIDEAPPGEGLLDLETVLTRFHQDHPNGYGLVEHLPDQKIPDALRAVQSIAEKAGVPLH